MNVKTRIALLCGVLALIVAPTAALAHGVEYETETPKQHKTPGASATTAEKAKAYGSFCSAFSRRHVAGEAGTPFSNCTTAMARAATTKKTGRQVCVGFSKAKLTGQKGTPFANCVSAAAKVKNRYSK